MNLDEIEKIMLAKAELARKETKDANVVEDVRHLLAPARAFIDTEFPEGTAISRIREEWTGFAKVIEATHADLDAALKQRSAPLLAAREKAVEELAIAINTPVAQADPAAVSAAIAANAAATPATPLDSARRDDHLRRMREEARRVIHEAEVKSIRLRIGSLDRRIDQTRREFEVPQENVEASLKRLRITRGVNSSLRWAISAAIYLAFFALSFFYLDSRIGGYLNSLITLKPAAVGAVFLAILLVEIFKELVVMHFLDPFLRRRERDRTATETAQLAVIAAETRLVIARVNA